LLVKETKMNACLRTCIVAAAATACVAVYAAESAASAAATKGDGYRTMAKAVGAKRARATAAADRRLAHCQAMKGDEKTGCEADAKQQLASDMSRGKPSHDNAGANPATTK
jgi:hypothetical protein